MATGGSVKPVRIPAMFAIFTLAEIFVFYWVQSVIGLGWAIGLVLLTAAVGVVIAVRAGFKTPARVRATMDQGGGPGRELADGAGTLVAGLLLIWPGFIGDLLGLLALIPVVRRPIYGFLSRRFGGRWTVITSRGVRRDTTMTLPGEEVIDVEGWENPSV